MLLPHSPYKICTTPEMRAVFGPPFVRRNKVRTTAVEIKETVELWCNTAAGPLLTETRHFPTLHSGDSPPSHPLHNTNPPDQIVLHFSNIMCNQPC